MSDDKDYYCVKWDKWWHPQLCNKCKEAHWSDPHWNPHECDYLELRSIYEDEDE